MSLVSEHLLQTHLPIMDGKGAFASLAGAVAPLALAFALAVPRAGALPFFFAEAYGAEEPPDSRRLEGGSDADL